MGAACPLPGKGIRPWALGSRNLIATTAGMEQVLAIPLQRPENGTQGRHLPLQSRHIDSSPSRSVGAVRMNFLGRLYWKTSRDVSGRFRWTVEVALGLIGLSLVWQLWLVYPNFAYDSFLKPFMVLIAVCSGLRILGGMVERAGTEADRLQHHRKGIAEVAGRLRVQARSMTRIKITIRRRNAVLV